MKQASINAGLSAIAPKTLPRLEDFLAADNKREGMASSLQDGPLQVNPRPHSKPRNAGSLLERKNHTEGPVWF
jgi:hypothetical protein